MHIFAYNFKLSSVITSSVDLKGSSLDQQNSCLCRAQIAIAIAMLAVLCGMIGCVFIIFDPNRCLSRVWHDVLSRNQGCNQGVKIVPDDFRIEIHVGKTKTVPNPLRHPRTPAHAPGSPQRVNISEIDFAERMFFFYKKKTYAC